MSSIINGWVNDINIEEEKAKTSNDSESNDFVFLFVGWYERE
jgi:hypothetical protein